MKKLILGIVLAAVLLTGCQFFECNPFIGTWAYSLGEDMIENYIFARDMTLSVSVTFLDYPWTLPATEVGTYSYTNEQLTMTLYGMTDTMLYEITGNQMTWTWPTDGYSITLVKQ